MQNEASLQIGIETQVFFLEEAMSYLSTVVLNLEQRLSQVVIPENTSSPVPASGMPTTKKESHGSPMSDRVIKITQKCEDLSGRVDYLLSRLDL